MENEFTWCVAYVDSKKIQHAEKQLAKNKRYKDVEAFIPTVQVLKKQFKGRDNFDNVPLLFNYGFFRIPIEKAMNPEFLGELRKDISCISGWVRDITRLGKNGMDVAFASDIEIAALIEYAKSNSIHTSEDIENLKEGDMITLIGYPWEGMQAEVISVDKRKKEAKVALIIEAELSQTVKVSFDNIFYTIYHGGFDEEVSKEKVFDKPLRVGADKSNKEYE